MNPLCCIAPVSIDRDRGNSVVSKSNTQCQLGLDSSIKTVNSASKSSFSTHDSSVAGDSVKSSSAGGLNHEDDDDVVVYEAKDSKVLNGGVAGSVAGILYKWVNYGKGWRSRWFVLEDGVLSYYKIHGPDKILMSPAKDRSVRVIGDESSKFVKKANWNVNRGGGSNGATKQCKPFGEIHLKVCSSCKILDADFDTCQCLIFCRIFYYWNLILLYVINHKILDGLLFLVLIIHTL
jgi:hypothetical protein